LYSSGFCRGKKSLTWIIHKLTAKVAKNSRETAESGPEQFSVLSLRTLHFFLADFAFSFAHFAVYELFRLKELQKIRNGVRLHPSYLHTDSPENLHQFQYAG